MIKALVHMNLLFTHPPTPPRVYRDTPLLSTLPRFSTSKTEVITVIYRRGRLKQLMDCFSQMTGVIEVLHMEQKTTTEVNYGRQP